MNRRDAIKFMTAALAGSTLPLNASFAVELAGGIVKLVVGVPPGGPTDMLARLVAPRLADALNLNVIVENRPGGGQTIAANLVAGSPTDGRNLFFCTQTLAANPFIYKGLSYDPVNAFRGVSLLATLPYGLFASNNVPADDLPSLISFLSKNPGKYNFASSGASSLPRLAGEIFKSKLGLNILHIPYAGSGPALISLASNETQIFFSDFLMVDPLIKSGRIKAIATAYDRRLEVAKDVPTFSEQGVEELSLAAWFGIVAPQKTPDTIIQKLNELLNEITNEKAIYDDIVSKGGVPRGDLTVEQFDAFIKDEMEVYKDIIGKINLEV